MAFPSILLHIAQEINKMGEKDELGVRVTKNEVVAAVFPMQDHWLPLSNLDLLLPPVDVGVFFCYDNPTSMMFGSMLTSLKKALALSLVSYYPFAGEVVHNSLGEPELLCNNRGVDFTEAVSDLELRHLDFHNPDLTFEGKLVPAKKQGVFAVQATELKCGGMVVGCTFDHRIADAFSANMFLVSWAKTARSEPTTSVVPIIRRSLLNPRRPGNIDPSLHDMYVTISSLPPPPEQPETDNDHLSSRMYYLTAQCLNELQSQANYGNDNKNDKRSKLESFSALLWKLVAQFQYQNKSDHDDRDTEVNMGVVVDGRSRINGDDDLMGSYFGNVLSIPYGGKRVWELREKPLSWVAGEVHAFLESAITQEHFLGLIDLVEAHRPEPMLAKIYAAGGNDDGSAVVVSSGQRFPASQVDFGWGRPALGSYHFPWRGSAGYVMPMPSPLENGDWVVYMHLFTRQLEFMEKEAREVFRPLTWEYLNCKCC